MTAIPLKEQSEIYQATLEEIKDLEGRAKMLRESVRNALDNGATVEEGRYSANIQTRTKAISVKRYREWLVAATSEGQVSRREKLVKRGEYNALIIK